MSRRYEIIYTLVPQSSVQSQSCSQKRFGQSERASACCRSGWKVATHSSKSQSSVFSLDSWSPRVATKGQVPSGKGWLRTSCQRKKDLRPWIWIGHDTAKKKIRVNIIASQSFKSVSVCLRLSISHSSKVSITFWEKQKEIYFYLEVSCPFLHFHLR